MTIELRAWHEINNEMVYPNIKNHISNAEILMRFDDDYIMLKSSYIDANGKPIYDGDILSDKWKAEVYQNDEWTFMIKFHTNPKKNKPISLKQYLAKRKKAGTSISPGYRDCIVIGNIYENPQLLK